MRLEVARVVDVQWDDDDDGTTRRSTRANERRADDVDADAKQDCRSRSLLSLSTKNNSECVLINP
jgi:hypothetical protein